jgi:hypothetical protein
MLSLDPALHPSSPIPGERRLWAAVLAQAVYELTGINTFTNRSYHTRIRYFARLWIDSDSRDDGSFRWVCDQLELDQDGFGADCWRSRTVDYWPELMHT